MDRITLAGARDYLAKHIAGGICSTDARVITRVNEAQKLLMDEGIYAEMKARYSFCQYDGCITLPRELEAILGVTVDKTPTRVQNDWYEFIDGGPGDQSCCGGNVLIDRGNVVTFRDICGAKYVRVYCDINEAAGSKILLKGLDENYNRVMTNYGGSWIDGEWISLESPYPKVSTKQYTYIESVTKPVTYGYVRLYQYDATAVTQSCIAIYAPGELYPTYRRYSIPSLITSDNSSTTAHTITILAKKRLVPVLAENDDLFVTNTHVLVCAIKALEFRDNNDMNQFNTYLAESKRAINMEAASHQGGNTAHVNIQGSCFFGQIANTQ